MDRKRIGRRRFARRSLHRLAGERLEDRTMLNGDPIPLGTITGQRVVEDFVGSFDRIDLYSFQLATSGDVAFTTFSQGDYLDIRIALDANANNTIDNGETVLDLGTIGLSHRAATRNLAAGNYLAEVSTNVTERNARFSLEINSNPAAGQSLGIDPGNTLNDAYDLGVISGTLVVADEIDRDTDRYDFFRFTLAEDRQVALRVSGDGVVLSNVDIIADRNGNGTGSSSESIAETNKNDDTDALAIEDLSAGEYFIRLEAGTPAGQYTLELDASVILTSSAPTDPGGTPAEAWNLGALETPRTVQEIVGGHDLDDLYRFSVDANTRVRLTLDPDRERVRFKLMGDFNGDGTIASSEVLAENLSLPGEDYWLEQDLTPGEYFVSVSPYTVDENSAYRFELSRVAELPSDPLGDPGDSPATARDLGELNDEWSVEDVVNGHDHWDYYRFTVDANARVRMYMSAASETTSFYLSADFNGDGTIDNSLASLDVAGGSDTWFTQDLTPGEYFVLVERHYRDDHSSAYRLELSREDLPADPLGDPGETIATARDLGELNDDWSVEEVVSGHDQWDYYRFTVDANARVRMYMSAVSENTTFYLSADFNGDGVIDNSLAGIDLTGGTETWFTQDLTPGEYYVRVQRYFRDDYSSAYRVALSREVLPADLLGDPGDTVATARDLGELNDGWSVEEVVSGHDQWDYYRFTVDANARVRMYMSAVSENTTFYLSADFNGDGVIDNSLAGIDLAGGTDTWFTQDLTPGEYFVRVQRYFRDDYNSAYRVALSREDLPADLLGDPGDTVATARDLGELNDDWSVEEVVSGHDQWDYYRFTVDANARVRMYMSAVSENTTFYLSADFNGDGVIDNSLAGIDLAGGTDTWFTQDLTPGEYFVRVQRYFRDDYNSAYQVALSREDLPADPLGDPGDTLPTARDLGILNADWIGEEVVSGHDRWDIYRFEIDADAHLRLKARAISERVDLDFVTDLNFNNVIDFGETVYSVDMTPGGNYYRDLDLTAGVYYARVERYFRDDFNSAFRLELNVSPVSETTPPDPGSTLTAAWDAGTLGDEQVYLGSVSPGDDRDIYRVTLNQAGKIDISLDELSADADLYLIADVNADGVWDSSETIESHTYFNASPRFLSEDLSPGDYFIAVVQGGATISTTYRLTVWTEALFVDPVVDPGESPATAYNLGQLSSGTTTTHFGVVGATDALDFYRFEVTEATRFLAWQDGATEHTAMYLIADLNADGVWDNGETIESNAGFSTSKTLVEDLNAGVYYVAVRRYSGPDYNTAYRLLMRTDTIPVDTLVDPGYSPATSYDLGSMLPGAEIVVRDVVGATDDYDIYRVELPQATRLRVWAEQSTEHTALYLIDDLNGNGIWDSNETIDSDAGFSTSHSLLEEVAAGTYFIAVRRYSGVEYNTRYRLTVRAESIGFDPGIDPGDSPATAKDLGIIETGTESIERQLVGSTDQFDLYRMEITEPTRLRIWQNGATEQTALLLMADLDEDGFWDGNETIEFDTGFSASHFLLEDVNPGVYYVAVRRYSGTEYNTAYQLTLRTEAIATDPATDPGNTPADAYDLGVLPQNGELVTTQVVGATDEIDFYRFEVSAPLVLHAWQNSATDQTGLYLIADLDSDGIWDSSDTIESDSGFSVSHSLREDLGPGVYFIGVRRYSGTEYNTAYRLYLRTEEIMVDPVDDPGNELATAAQLGVLDADLTFSQTVGARDRDDFYTFTLDRITEFQATLYDLAEDAQLYLYADVDGNGSLDSSEDLGRSARGGTDSEYIREQLGPGTYFVRIFSDSNEKNTSYSLEFKVAGIAFENAAPGPAVESVTPIGSPVIDTIDVTFTSAINTGTFDASDVSFTGPAGDVTLNNVEVLGAQSFRLHFADPASSGIYTLRIGPEIEDSSGNPMNQDGDSFAGEAVDDSYQTQIQIIATDLAVDSVTTAENSTFFGSPLTVNFEVRNAGVISLATPWIDRVWLSSDPILDNSDLRLGDFPSDAQLPLAAGASYQVSQAFDLPLITNLEAGDYYVIVKSDVFGVQPELSEANNLRVSALVTINHPPLPDLTVSSITVPIEAFAGTPIPITWELTNAGDAAAVGPFHDLLYLSVDDSPGSDIFLGTFEFEGAIAAGQTVTRSHIVTVPNGYLGDFHLLVTTDAFNQVYERTGEGNNISASLGTIDISQAPVPDLRVASVTAPPTAFSEQEVVVTWTVENRGDAPTNSPVWYDRIYLSDDPQYNPLDDTFLGEITNASYLDVGDQYVNSLAVTLPRGIEGDYYFVIVTDARNDVFELDNEDNNAGAGSPTDVTLTPPPDLIVSETIAPTVGLSGREIVVRWTIENQGPGETRVDRWHDSVYLSRNDTFDATDTFLGAVQHNGALSSGEDYTIEDSFTLPGDTGGSYFVLVVTDSTSAVYEHDQEGNNVGVAATTLNVTPVRSDLEVTEITIQPTARAGTSTTFQWRVENLGFGITPSSYWRDWIYLSANDTFDPSSDLLIGTRAHDSALEPDEGYNASREVVLPQGLSGDYYVFIVTDADGSVLELDDSNNHARAAGLLHIDSLPADLIAEVDSLPATVSAGSNFLLSWSITNQGLGDTITDRWTNSVYLSSDTTFGNGDDRLLTRRDHTGLLSPSQAASVANLAVELPFDVAPGNYHLFVVADTSDRVHEDAAEGNNASAATPLTVTRATANLQVTSVELNTHAADSGEFVNVTWTVTNNSPVATEALYWHDSIYLSSDQAPGNDFYLSSVQHNNLLAAGESYTTTASVRVPNGIGGDYHAYVVTDDFNRVLEDPTEADNSAFDPTPLTITLVDAPANPDADADPDPSFPPELEVISVAAPATAISGQTVNVSWTVRNNSYTTQPWHWTDAVYLSTDQILDSRHDLSLGFIDRPTNDLLAGQQYDQTASFEIPAGVAGPYYVFVRTDAGRRIPEGNELNNEAYDLQAINIALPPPADLAAGAIVVPATGVPGETASITYRIDNQGSLPATGSWTDTLYLSSDAAWDINDPPIGSVLHHGGLAAGDHYIETLEAPLPGVRPGNYHVIVRSDIRDQIPEDNEANNHGASGSRISVDVESLNLGIPTNGSLAEDQSKYYRVDVPAGETMRVSFDSSSATAANELFIRFGDLPNRSEFDFAFNAAFEPDQQILVPVTESGTYYILAFGDLVEEGTAPFTIQADILDFGIESIDVDFGSRFGSTTIVVSGAKFTPDTDVEMVGPGGVVHPAARVWFINEATLWATLDLQGLDADLYDVQVVDNGMDDALVDAFRVTSGPLGSFDLTIDAPERLLTGQSGFATIRYRNLGESDIVAPALVVEAMNANLIEHDDLVPLGNLVTLMAINPDGPAGILPPGFEQTILIPFQPTIDLGTVEVRVEDLGDPENTIDWAALEEGLRPQGMADDDWQLLWDSFRQTVGNDVETFQSVIAERASALSHGGTYTADLPRLVAHELFQVDTLPTEVLRETLTSGLNEIAEFLDNVLIQIVAAFDPNEIIGPTGIGAERWVSGLQPLNYVVRFDNDPLLASAAARRVRITVPLDVSFDPRSVRFEDFGFGDLIVELPGTRGFYASRLDLRDSIGVFVDVVAGVEINPGQPRTGEVFWEMTAIDPATGLPPIDPVAGFLPPNLDGTEGQGFANFSVRPRDATASGAFVEADAKIIFDTNPPVETPKWNNTIDAQVPISSVTEVAEGPAQGVYEVSWFGEDEPAGAGLNSFDVYLARNEGPFELWMAGTTLRSSLFAAESDESYAFFSLAADRTGNRELAPATADATIGLRNVVVGRRLFYNNSAFDTVSDDDAIAAGKTALLPGETATAANIASFLGGINGLMIDIADLPESAVLDPATDFEFRTGNDDSPDTWSLLGVDPTITIRPGEGTGGTDRVVLVWPDNTITNTWLQVRVRANANTGLVAEDVFYFGNQIADVTGDGLVDGTDFSFVRANPKTFLDPATVDNLFDINRDSRVNAADTLLVRDHATLIGAGLQLITPVPGSLAKTSTKLNFSLSEGERAEPSIRKASRMAAFGAVPGDEDAIDAALQQEYAIGQIINEAVRSIDLLTESQTELFPSDEIAGADHFDS